MWHFLSFVSGGLAMFAVSMLTFRQYMRAISHRFQAYESRIEQKRVELKLKTKALREIIRRVNHEGLRPRLASLLGLPPLLSHDLKEARLNTELARKPNHHRYADLASSHLDKVDETLVHLEIVANDINKYLGETYKEFEDLQDD
jgi:hypothetical protein